MSAVNQSNNTNFLDQAESVISNGAATSESDAYKACVDSNNRLCVNPTPKYIGRAIVNNDTVALSETYTDVLSMTGFGELTGFKFKVSNDSASVRLEIDGTECFDININTLRNCNLAEYNNSGLNRCFGTAQYGEIEFFPNTPWHFNTSLKLQIKKDVSWSISRQRTIIIYAV